MARYGIKRHLKAVVDIPRWLGYENIKAHGRLIQSLAKDAVGHRSASTDEARSESFEQAVARLELSVDDLQKRKRLFFWSAILYATVALLVLGYSVHLWYHDGWASAMIAVAIAWVIGAFSFREHFWYTQIKCKRLGLSVSDWARQTFVFGEQSS